MNISNSGTTISNQLSSLRPCGAVISPFPNCSQKLVKRAVSITFEALTTLHERPTTFCSSHLSHPSDISMQFCTNICYFHGLMSGKERKFTMKSTTVRSDISISILKRSRHLILCNCLIAFGIHVRLMPFKNSACI